MPDAFAAEQLVEVEHIVRRRAGLTLQATLLETKQRCVLAAYHRSGAASAEQYIDRLRDDQELLDELLDELTIGETYFFRTPQQFRQLESLIFPEILRRRGADHTIRIWSAGCATGEEPYSVAMVGDRLGLRLRVLATDVSRRLLTKAQAGCYSSWALRDRGVDALPYLTRRGSAYQLAADVRRQVIFEYLNLAADCYPSIPRGLWGMDVILCRNVLIYFDRETTAGVAQRLYNSLAEGGWLITGAADAALRDFAPFELVTTDAGVLYRRPAGTIYDPAREKPPQVRAAATDTSPAIPLKSTEPTHSLRSAEASGRVSVPPRKAAPAKASTRGGVVEQLRDMLLKGATEEAQQLVDAALARHPLEAELYYWSAVLLIDRGRDEEALHRLSRALYLDRTLLVAHFVQGLVLQRKGDTRGALRAFENVRQLCQALPRETPVPLTNAQTVEAMAEVVAVQMELLRAIPPVEK